MDNTTFKELLEKGELSLILMDGGADLTPSQMRQVKNTAKALADERLEKMALELAATPGYREMMLNPLMSALLPKIFNTNTEQTTQSVSTDKPVDTNTPPKVSEEKKSAIKPEPSIPSTVTEQNKEEGTPKSLEEVAAELYSFLATGRKEDVKLDKNDKKYRKTLDKTKEKRTKQLIGLFKGKSKKETPKKETKEEVSKKEETNKKTETTKEVPKTETPAPTNNALPKVLSTGAKVVGTAVAVGAGTVGLEALAAKITKNEGGNNPNQANIVKGHSAKEAQIVKGNIDVTTGAVFQKSLEEMTLGEAYDLGTRRSQHYNARGAGAAMGKYGFMPIAIKDRGIALFGKDWRDKPFDSKTQDELNKSLIINNLQKLQKAGIPPTERNLYLMHFFGNTIQTAEFLKSSDDASMAPILNMYNNGATANPDVAKLKVGEYKKRFLAKFDDTPANLQEPSKAQPVPTETKPAIPEKIKSSTNQSAPNIAMLNKNTVVSNGGTQYNVSKSDQHDGAKILEKQYN